MPVLQLKNRLLNLSLIVLMLCTAAVTPANAHTFATWNMQGATSGGVSVYDAVIRNLFSVRGGSRSVDILSLQEAGPVPVSAVRIPDRIATTVDYTGNTNSSNYAVREYIYGQTNNQNRVLRNQSEMRIFHQELDVNGHRVHNAIVVPNNMAVDRIVVIPPAFAGARPLMGAVIRGRAYFTFHALSGGGNDAPGAVLAVQGWLNNNSHNVDYAIIGGDFNRSPDDFPSNRLPGNATILRTNNFTHRSQHELDYMIALAARQRDVSLAYPQPELSGDDGGFTYSDHRLVTIGPPTTPPNNQQNYIPTGQLLGVLSGSFTGGSQ